MATGATALAAVLVLFSPISAHAAWWVYYEGTVARNVVKSTTTTLTYVKARTALPGSTTALAVAVVQVGGLSTSSAPYSVELSFSRRALTAKCWFEYPSAGGTRNLLCDLKI